MSWARVGMKVVCINDDPNEFVSVIVGRGYKPLWGLPIVKGQTYTVAAVNEHAVLGGVCLRLSEVPSRGIDSNGVDVGYAIERFRPIVSKTIEQDVQMFKRIADTVPSLEDAE